MSSPAGSGSGSGGGLGRSAPIRTVGGRGTIGGAPSTSRNINTNSNSNIGIPSLPGSTPPLVKSKLALTPGRVPSNNKPSSNNAAPKYQSYDPYHQQPPPPPSAQTLTSPIITTNHNTDDAIASSRITPGNTDPVVMSRQSPGVAATTTIMNTPNNSAQLQAQPHIVPLPPNNPNLVTTQPTHLSHPLETSTTTAGGGYNHGLVQQQQQHQQQKPYSQQQSATPAAVNHPLKQTTSYAQQPTQQRQTSSPTKQRNNTKSTSSDDDVDIFLKGGSNNNNKKLHPTPLPTTITDTLSKCKLLVERRAYGDVIRVTNDIFTSQDVGSKDPGKGDGGVYSRLYNELIQSASSTNNESAARDGALSAMDVPTFNNDSVAATQEEGMEEKKKKLHCEEMSELLAIRFISQLKLRRYVDLGKEIELLGLMPYLPDIISRASGSAAREDDEKQQQPPHVRAISGIPTSDMENASITNTPGTPGTLGTETSIDVLSSSTKEQHDQSSSEKLIEKPLAWKEGSLHSSRASNTPSWVPFGLRILAAHQLQYNDGSSKAIDVLYDLRDRATRTEYWNTNGMEIWKGVIDNALVNSFVRKREWRLALKSLDDLLNGLEDGVDREVRWWCTSNGEVNVSDTEKKQMKEIITSAARVELLSRQLLILLQSGAIAAGDMIQNDVRLYATMVQSQLNALPSNMTLLVRITKEMALVRQVPIRQQINEGLLHFAQLRYNDAATHFRHAMTQQRQLDSVITSTVTECPSYKDLSSPTLGFDSSPSLTVEALNNLSLCLLYSGNMRSAVTELEGLIREGPCVYLTEGLAFNLCTLYELGLDGEECTRKKKLLQRVGKRFYLHDIGVESFRLG